MAITYGLSLSTPTAEKCSDGLAWTFVRAGNPATANLIVKLRDRLFGNDISDERVEVLRDGRLFLMGETNFEGIVIFDLPSDEYMVRGAGKNQAVSIKEHEPPVRIEFAG